ncbi:hypothetical protein BDR22DRAFT_963594 [Usnea florida]
MVVRGAETDPGTSLRACWWLFGTYYPYQQQKTITEQLGSQPPKRYPEELTHPTLNDTQEMVSIYVWSTELDVLWALISFAYQRPECLLRNHCLSKDGFTFSPRTHQIIIQQKCGFTSGHWKASRFSHPANRTLFRIVSLSEAFTKSEPKQLITPRSVAQTLRDTHTTDTEGGKDTRVFGGQQRQLDRSRSILLKLRRVSRQEEGKGGVESGRLLNYDEISLFLEDFQTHHSSARSSTPVWPSQSNSYLEKAKLHIEPTESHSSYRFVCTSQHEQSQGIEHCNDGIGIPREGTGMHPTQSASTSLERTRAENQNTHGITSQIIRDTARAGAVGPLDSWQDHLDSDQLRQIAITLLIRHLRKNSDSSLFVSPHLRPLSDEKAIERLTRGSRVF